MAYRRKGQARKGTTRRASGSVQSGSWRATKINRQVNDSAPNPAPELGHGPRGPFNPFNLKARVDEARGRS